VWLLAAQKYTSSFWLTYRQAQELGGSVRKGQKGMPVVFWRVYFADGCSESEEQVLENTRYTRPWSVPGHGTSVEPFDNLPGDHFAKSICLAPFRARIPQGRALCLSLFAPAF
jgi:antirestriction protein ArdC